MTTYGLTSKTLAANQQPVIDMSTGTILPLSSFEYQDYLTWLVQGNTPTPADAFLAQQAFLVALKSGVSLTWTSSISLNGIYAVDPITNNNITSEAAYIRQTASEGVAQFSNSQVQHYWPDKNGTPRLMSIPQFLAFAKAIAQYVDGITTAYQQGIIVTGPGNATVQG